MEIRESSRWRVSDNPLGCVPCHTHYGKQHWADLRNPAAEHPCTALPPWAAAVARLWSAAQEQMPPYQLPNP